MLWSSPVNRLIAKPNHGPNDADGIGKEGWDLKILGKEGWDGYGLGKKGCEI